MERLILCGGGHVSLETAYMAARLGFELVVIDDRMEFANQERFPMAAQVLAMPFEEALDRLGSRPTDYFAILTRGHTHDSVCLTHILEGDYAYIGMIGSKTKVAAVRTLLYQKGYTQRQLDCVHAPIGLSIGAQTPAEIAVAILAEIIQTRSELGSNVTHPPKSPGVLVVITKKSGSAPRGVGTWMLVQPDGSTVGTIGGGSVEYQVIQDALEMWSSSLSEMERSYDLSHAAAELGMVCGGKISVSLRAQYR